MQPLVSLIVGGQELKMVLDASSGNTIVFVEELHGCVPRDFSPCYSFMEGERRKTLKICEENNDDGIECDSRTVSKYKCTEYLSDLKEAKPSGDALIIDGIEYDQQAVEAKEEVEVRLQGSDGGRNISWPSIPIRVLVGPMHVPLQIPWLSLRLFEEVSGILGASGPTLSCRNETVWSMLLKKEKATHFAFDLLPPPNATIQREGSSRIVLNHIDDKYKKDIVWSQPKQTGDLVNDGMHEFLMNHVSVCGTDILYNISSSWLAVIDTSGPCLTLPGFLFDRLRSHAPIECPFDHGNNAWGRLCWPKRGKGDPKMPSISFQLEDISDVPAPWLHLPLERLVFRNGTGQELICLARDDTSSRKATADMMYSHIAVGSLALASFYTVVDLERRTIGLATKGDPKSESSEASCAVAPECTGMQEFYPPLNICEDPDCSQYMFMTMDERTKVCRWMRAVPAIFGVALMILALLDLFSHRLYKQSIQRAIESCQ